MTIFHTPSPSVHQQATAHSDYFLRLGFLLPVQRESVEPSAVPYAPYLIFSESLPNSVSTRVGHPLR